MKKQGNSFSGLPCFLCPYLSPAIRKNIAQRGKTVQICVLLDSYKIFAVA